MKRQYKNLKFRQATIDKIATANEIIAEYEAHGLSMTLRQLYYQFVARGLMDNKQAEYKKLSATMSKARLVGLVDWDALVDRTRFLRGRSNELRPATALNKLRKRYTIDMWSNQECRVEVWIEKDALIGVIDDVCTENDVNFFACRGYVSQTAQYMAGRRAFNYSNYNNKHTIIIHLGDHDPSGLDMTVDNRNRLDMFSEDSCTIERIALNMDQVEEHRPPPNPAKLTDARSPAYIAEFGSSSWELDALDPLYLQKIVSEKINQYKDPEKWEEREQQLNVDLQLLDRVYDFSIDEAGKDFDDMYDEE